MPKVLRLSAFPPILLLLLLAACSGGDPAATPGSPTAPQAPTPTALPDAAAAAPVIPAGKAAAPDATPAPAAAAPAESVVQDPVQALVDVLLAQRDEKDRVYLADCERASESTVLAAIREELRKRKAQFDEPGWPNHQYYLNNFIPMTRRSGKAWLIYDPGNAPLARLLEARCLSIHKITFERDFAGARLVLVLNEFRREPVGAIALEPVTSPGATVTNIVFTPDDAYMFVTSKEGQIRWFHQSSPAKGEALRMPRGGDGAGAVFTGGESGLIGMALHPDFAQNNKAYIHYNWQHPDGSREAILSEWTVDLAKAPKEVTIGGERKILTIPQVRDNHNAGALVFGPDGYLYVAVGDGEDGQWTIGRSPANTLRGKVLRIDVNGRDEGKEYAVPADNPFVGNGDFPPETWAWGFRNPWRLSFAPDGRLIAGEIGEDVNEELTFVVPGKHHGWPYYEGLYVRNPWTLDVQHQPPILAYSRDHGMSVIGGYVYTGDQLAELRGQYIFADFLSGRIWSVELPPTDATIDIAAARELLRVPLMFATFGQDHAGNLYAGAHTGQVFKLVPGSAEAPTQDVTEVAQKADPGMVRGFFGAEFTAAKAPESTKAQVDLGLRLFHEPQLAKGGKQSCATCHDLSLYGQDGRTKVDCGDGRPARNTASVFNVQRQFAQFRDYTATTVEEAVGVKLRGAMGIPDDKVLAERVSKNQDLQSAFAVAYPGQDAPVSIANVEHAIGAFLRTLTTRSRWDDFLDGDDKALSDAELVGLNTFITAGCVACHQYRGLGGGMPQKLGMQKPWRGSDKGRGAAVGAPEQDYFFKVSTLWNVAETAPYYHDGSIATLEEAVRDMADIQLGRTLTDAQVNAIVIFLKALTGKPPQAH